MSCKCMICTLYFAQSSVGDTDLFRPDPDPTFKKYATSNYTLINIEIQYMLYNVLCCIIFSSLVLQMTSHYRNFGMLYGSLKIHTIHVTSPCVVLVYTTRLLKEVFISASLFFKLELGLWNICKKQSFQKQVLYFPKIILKNLILCLHLCLGCWLYVHWSLVVPLLPLPPILGPLLLSLTGYD